MQASDRLPKLAALLSLSLPCSWHTQARAFAAGAGEVRVGDIVQVFLESVETPEGDMLVSGQQAAQERRFQAIWNELEQRMKQRDKVQGEWPQCLVVE